MAHILIDRQNWVPEVRRASRRLVASWPAPERHRRAIPKTGNGRSGSRQPVEHEPY